MIVVLKGGFIGRGINGVSEFRIHTDDNIDLSKDIITFTGEMKYYDNYFSGHPFAGEKIFTVKTENILCLID